MILTFACTATVTCDICQVTVALTGKSGDPMTAQFEALRLFRDSGWVFRYPESSCPACRLPPRPTGRATMIKT